MRRKKKEIEGKEGKFTNNLLEMEKFKGKIAILEKKNEMLQEEKLKLGVRAAIGFEELTPRFKDFEKSFTELGITKPKPDYPSLDSISSISYIKALIEALKAKSKNWKLPGSKRAIGPSS